MHFVMAARSLARGVLETRHADEDDRPRPSEAEPKRAPKLSRKAWPTGGDEYAAKFFPYIEKVARRLARRLPAHVEIDDLISSGVIGLMEAAERFDPKRVDRFEAFAEFRIRGAMLDDLRPATPCSRDMRRLSNELRDATRRLEAQLGPHARPRGDSPSAWASGRRAVRPPAEAVGVVGGRHRRRRAGPAGAHRRRKLGRGPVRDTARTARRCPAGGGHRRPAREDAAGAVAVLLRQPQPKEIGEVLGVTESRVCQIHGEATRRLRENLSELDEIVAA